MYMKPLAFWFAIAPLSLVALATLIVAVPIAAAPDPAGDSATDAADLTAFDATGQGGQLVLTLTAADGYDFAGTQILLDTDLDGRTGFALDTIGADLLIENDLLYAFGGDDPAGWTWSPRGSVTRAVENGTLKLTVNGDALGSSQLAVVARTVNADYSVADRAPDDAAMLVRLETLAEGSEAAGDAGGDASRDLTAVDVMQDASKAVVKITTAAKSDFANTLVFIDADRNADTGYRPDGDTALGFDFVINGGTLSKHADADPAAWAWEAVGPVDQILDGHSLTLRFNANQLGHTTPRLGVWNMSADWMVRVDRAPDRGLIDLKLDAALFAPLAPEPQIKPAARKANADLPPRQRVADSDSFYCYYGSGKVAELSHYDVVILHSPQMAVDDIAKLKNLGVVTIGYITVGEDDSLRVGDGTGPDGKASWYFDRDEDGQPDRNKIWNSWYANTNDPQWRADRVKEAKRLVEQEGYDGIFLDTIDTAQLYPEGAEGMVKLIADFRKALPESPIILNQGFKLFDRLGPMADGLMLESFTATYDFESKQYMMNYPASLDAHTRNVMRNLQPTLEKHPMPIFVLDYARADDLESIQTAADRAVSFGYQFAAAPIFLDEVYVNHIVGEPDPGWLEMQATPELMSVVLAEAANGFPAGTTLMPNSCYAGYTVAPLVDGIEDRSELHWSRAAWASSDEVEGETWLRMTLPEAVRGGELTITWATDSGITHVSENYRVETLGPDGTWQDAGSAVTTTEQTSTHALPDRPFTDLRILQPEGGGSVERPGLLWIAQLQLIQP